MRSLCTELEESLEALVDGRLEDDRCALFEHHLLGCERCATLVELATVPAPELAGGQSALTDAVLRQTSGPTCERAEPQISDRLDGVLAPVDRGLLALHLEHCAGCRALERALTALSVDLPALAELQPEPDFVRRVMAASLPVAIRLRRWRRRHWSAWILRPRFAMEMAYAMTAVLVLMLSIPGTPLEAMPRQAAELVRTSPAGALERPVQEGLAAWGKTQTSRRLSAGYATARTRLPEVVDRTGSSFRTFFDNVASWWENATEETSSRQSESTEETP